MKMGLIDNIIETMESGLLFNNHLKSGFRHFQAF